jgi:hypothetical protein
MTKTEFETIRAKLAYLAHIRTDIEDTVRTMTIEFLNGLTVVDEEYSTLQHLRRECTNIHDQELKLQMVAKLAEALDKLASRYPAIVIEEAATSQGNPAQSVSQEVIPPLYSDWLDNIKQSIDNFYGYNQGHNHITKSREALARAILHNLEPMAAKQITWNKQVAWAKDIRPKIIKAIIDTLDLSTLPDNAEPLADAIIKELRST